MDASLRKFQVDGMAAAVTAWDHQLVVTTDETTNPVTTTTLHGIQTDVEVDPGSLEQFGFHVKRVLCFVVNNPSILSTISIGMKAVDNNGEPCKFLYHKRDFLGIHLYFGTVNR